MSGEWYVKQNVSYACYLFERAANEGSLDAAANLGRIYTLGIYDFQTQRQIYNKNGTKAIEFLNQCIAQNYPMGYHTLGEIIQFQLFDLDN